MGMGISSGVSSVANPNIRPWSPAPWSLYNPWPVFTPWAMSGLCSWIDTNTPASSQSIGRRVVQAIGQAWAWFFLLILLVFFSLTGEGFLSAFNLQSILANVAIMLIMALGQTFVILSAGIDLSVGAVYGLAGVAFITLQANLGVTGAIIAALAIFIIGRWIANLVTRGVRRLLERAKVLPELAAACTLAAFEGVAERFGPADHVVLVLCGGNVSVADLVDYRQRFDP